MWDRTLEVLRDPLFAVVLSVVLAVLASQVGGCIVRLVLALGSMAAFIWLVVRFDAFREVVVAVIGAVATIGAVLIICLTVIAVVTIVAVHSMSRRAETGLGQHSSPVELLPSLPAAEEPLRHQLEARDARFIAIRDRLMAMVEKLEDQVDTDGGFRLVTSLTAAYFSGLSAHAAELKQRQHESGELLRELAEFLPLSFSGVDSQELLAIASAKSYLPSKDELSELVEMDRPGLVYLLARLLVLHPKWRIWATTLAKSDHGNRLVTDCLESL
jgi:hypothetical protein